MESVRNSSNFVEKEKQDLINNIADKLHLYEMMLRSGECNGMTFKNLNRFFLAICLFFDSDMDYEDARRISGKSLNSLMSTMSRNAIRKPIKKSMFSFGSLLDALPTLADKLRRM